jgi:hypothetical protein
VLNAAGAILRDLGGNPAVADERPTYRLALRAALPRYGEPPAIIRLRVLLKAALCCWGFRATEVREVESEAQAAAEQAAAGPQRP